MAQTIEGNLDGRGLKFAIVAARFNSFIVERLLEGALDALRRTGAEWRPQPLSRCLDHGRCRLSLRKSPAKGSMRNHLPRRGHSRRNSTFRLCRRERGQWLAAIAAANRCSHRFRRSNNEHRGPGGGSRRDEGRNKGFDAAMTAIEMAQLLRTLRSDSSK